MPTVIPAKQLQVIEDNQSGLADSLLAGETGWSSEDSTLFIKEPGGGLKPVVPAATEEYVDTAVAMEREERLAGDSSLQASIDAHTSRTDNPHNVTAGQVGAYTQQEVDDAISDAISGEVGGWLGNLTVAEVNALATHKKGDSATLLDAGTVMPGNVTVDVGDDIMWVDSLGVWQPKITDHLHHDETLVGTGSANDPLGVNPETIEDNILRMRYRGGGRLKFWRTNPLPTT